MKISKTLLVVILIAIGALGVLIWDRIKTGQDKALLKQELKDIRESFQESLIPISTKMDELKKLDAEKMKVIADMLLKQDELEKAKALSDKAAKEAIAKLLAAKPEDQVTEVQRITGEKNIQYFADRKTVEFSLAAFQTAAVKLKEGEHFSLVERVEFGAQIVTLKSTVLALQEDNTVLRSLIAQDDARWLAASTNIDRLTKLVNKAIKKPFGQRLLEFGKDFAIGFGAGYLAHK